jgi:hypothetical protein
MTPYSSFPFPNRPPLHFLLRPGEPPPLATHIRRPNRSAPAGRAPTPSPTFSRRPALHAVGEGPNSFPDLHLADGPCQRRSPLPPPRACRAPFLLLSQWPGSGAPVSPAASSRAAGLLSRGCCFLMAQERTGWPILRGAELARRPGAGGDDHEQVVRLEKKVIGKREKKEDVRKTGLRRGSSCKKIATCLVMLICCLNDILICLNHASLLPFIISNICGHNNIVTKEILSCL